MSAPNPTRANPRGLLAPVLGLLLLAGCAPATNRDETGAGPAPATSEGFVAMEDGTRLFYRTVGDGPQAVILPADLFLHPAFARLSPGRTLYFYDMRNRGRSDSVAADRENSIRRDVADLEGLRAHFGLDRVDLVGFSYLGLMVALYAMEHPERAGRIVQLGPVPMRFDTRYPPGLGPADYMAAMDSSALAGVRKLQQEGYPASHPREYCEREWEVTRFTLVGDPGRVDRLGPAPCAMPNEWPVNLERHFARHFASVQALQIDPRDVARIQAPVLTIHGTLDRNAPYGAGREWAMTIPDARLVTVDGGAHCSWADDPDLVFGAIDTFLKGERPTVAEKVRSLERPS